ncbi:hypothetical protein ZYGR_0AD03740 [Zygosaccharomyces rouxii]|uniref:ZYRO0G14784p n=2 Tax=Zygosaccharomyces rouxii TaxID=4956 RepID=C5E0Q6_ZYGRC|nr:uncharacterized protein ZYRO0G14784g [Zygosaccharomyces rouxii]KAH9202684.1 cohesin loading factor [Zygosaccharomyces rouxii]GAV51191.1 hypothetical protein ZYGR_0AD03740 [Zygosaccharomyces rouxii]CAR29690.1 ZYRO0G14784p [Zygosaccharomyces rouxii]
MSLSRLPVDVVYHLSHEYRQQAYLHAHTVRDERLLKQYYTLISMAIKCLEYAKAQYALSMDQDYQITMELVEILVKETHNLDLAEQYLSSLKERLKNHQVAASTETLFRQRMHCEFLSLYEMPLRRDSKFHFKIASRNCDALLQYFQNVGAEYQAWKQVFEYVNVCLNAKLGKRSRARADFIKLDNQNMPGQWGAFITLSHASFLLSRRYTISPEIRQKLNCIDVSVVGPHLFSWKMVLELYIQVFEDKNITNNLNQFKQFFAEYKGFLLDNDGVCDVNIDEKVRLRLTLLCVFQYRDLKNVLLLLQSVSFLVNCHDKKANFSTKFLPKVQSTTVKLIESNKKNGGKSLSSYDEDRNLYEHILSCVDFYQKWENFLLSSEVKPLNQATGDTIGLLYSPLLEAMKLQVAGNNESVGNYEKITDSKQVNEVRIIAMVNSFVIRASRMSKNIQREENMARCNSLWAEMDHILRESDLWKNQMWGCTMTILWLLSHLEPFTSSPMPSTDEEKSRFLTLLRNYYMVNKVIKEDSQEMNVDGGNLKIKKSVLLQILLNYLGGRLLEQDLAVICQVSGLCFKLSRQQNSLYLQYVIGIWHLLNSTVAMNSKEVTIMRSKLEAIVKDLVK